MNNDFAFTIKRIRFDENYNPSKKYARDDELCEFSAWRKASGKSAQRPGDDR